MRFEFAFLGFVIAGIGMLVAMVTRQQKVEELRLKVIEAALQRPELDPALRQQLIDALTKRSRPSQWLAATLTWTFWQRVLFAIGWMLFVIAGGILAMGWMGLIRVPTSDIAFVMLTGLAMLTLPPAIEELRTRGGGIANPR